MDPVKQRWLSRLPDLPRWVETRDLLSWKGSVVAETSARSGFVVWSEDDGLGSVVGDPDPAGLARAAVEVPELLAFPENIEKVRALLRDFRAEPAAVLSAPAQLPPSSPHPCRVIGHVEIASLKHIAVDLADELSDAADDGVTVVAAYDATLAVAFSYVAAETETLWDVSIDTVESHRRRGYAAAAVVHLMRLMKERGKAAVWGAVSSNPASMNLALRLGFVEVDALWVLTRRTPSRGTRDPGFTSRR
jgi:GNAT superfamily N-acetyltransferase